MKENRQGKIYIGKEEAFEIMIERGIEKLPRKGQEWYTVRQVPLPSLILGKDEQGYFLDESFILRVAGNLYVQKKNSNKSGDLVEQSCRGVR